MQTLDADGDINLTSADKATIQSADSLELKSTASTTTVSARQELDLTSTAGDVDINSGGNGIVDIDGASGVEIDSVANDVDITAAVNLTNSATAGSITNTAGQDINNTAGRNYNVTSTNYNNNSDVITLGKTDGSSTVILPGLKGSSEEAFVTVKSDGTIAKSSFSVNDVKDALQKFDEGINQVGAMSMAVSALPNLTNGDKKYGCGVGTGVMGSAWAGAAGCVVKVTNSIWVNGAVSYSPGVKTEFSETSNFAGRLGAFWQF